VRGNGKVVSRGSREGFPVFVEGSALSRKTVGEEVGRIILA